MLGSLITAGANLLGGWMNSNNVQQNNQNAMQMAQENIRLQKKFAQEGIQWKVKDARKAGVHPLYALGAQTHSFAPVSVGLTPDTAMGDALSKAGQNIGRAVAAGSTPTQRATAYERTIQALSVERASLENAKLRSEIASQTAQIGPPIPIPQDKPEKRPPIVIGGLPWETDPNTTNASEGEKRYGDDIGGLVSGLLTGWQDIKHNLKGMSLTDILRAIDRRTRIW